VNPIGGALPRRGSQAGHRSVTDACRVTPQGGQPVEAIHHTRLVTSIIATAVRCTQIVLTCGSGGSSQANCEPLPCTSPYSLLFFLTPPAWRRLKGKNPIQGRSASTPPTPHLREGFDATFMIKLPYSPRGSTVVPATSKRSASQVCAGQRRGAIMPAENLAVGGLVCQNPGRVLIGTSSRT